MVHHAPSILLQGVVYLGAAVLAVPISRRIGLGSVLGYLLAGILIGPWGLGLIHDVESVLQFAEFGVVMMLFLIGLELEPDKLWNLRMPIFGLGGMQVLLTMLPVTALGLAFHLDWRIALVIGMGVAMSSTAIAVQTLSERGMLPQPSGQIAFAVLLFQDLAVIPLMLGLALLVPQTNGMHVDWMVVLRGLALIVVIVMGGNFVLRPVLRYIANTGMREIFVAFALFLIMSVALLMQSVGLSMALGAFLAGVLLADSEYRQELELDIEPFKGLLLGLFFIAVGMSVDVGLIIQRPVLVLSLALGFVLLKILLLFGFAKGFKQSNSDSVIFALTLSQIGEFAFVIYSTAAQMHIFSASQASLLNAVVAISMLTTPLIMLLYSYSTKHRLKPDKAFDEIEAHRQVIVAGYGRFGQVVSRLLNGVGIAPTVIEYDPNQIETVRRFGFKGYYGDITRPDVLEAAGIATAKLIVIAIDDVEASLSTAKYVKEHYPQVEILVRARNRTDTYQYMELGLPSVRETFHSALVVGQEALKKLGFGAYQARRIAWQFQQHDEKILKEALLIRHDQQKLITHSAQSRQDLSDLLHRELTQRVGDDQDSGFDT
jgi:monovalent cation:proton antiporter-2 (CPA2) family protein